MKALLSVLVLLTSLSAMANDKEAFAKMMKTCYESVSLDVSIVLSQAYHDAETQSEEDETRSVLNAFTDTMEAMLAMPTGCFESSETRDEELNCLIDSYSTEVKRISTEFNASEIVKTTPACALL